VTAGGGKPTIVDVARVAGVSRSAVSKVIRDAYGVSDGMRERVTRAIDELDYRPNVTARSLRGAGFTLGIEMPGMSNPFFSMIIAGATEALAGSKYQLIVAPVMQEVEHDYTALEVLADRQVDGLIAISPLADLDWLERFGRRTPLVMLGRHDDSVSYDTVTGDDALGTDLVMDHLLGLGHRRILHLTRTDLVTDPRTGTPHAVRYARYRERMAEAGLAHLEQVARTGGSEDEAYVDTRELLRSSERPTAIFAGNDEIALGAQRALIDEGLTPADVSIVGYDDVAVASHPAISLTTVNQSGEEMGARSVRLVLERLGGRTAAEHVQVVPTLAARRSSAPPAAP
jgi:LacI family transcriptional regulator